MAFLAIASVFLAVSLRVSAEDASGLILLDSPARGFLRDVPADAVPSTALSLDAVSALLSSFLGVAPTTTVTPQVAKQMDEVSFPDLFHKPTVVFSLNVAGVGPEEGSALLGARSGMLREVDASATEVMRGMDSIFKSMPGAIEHFPLDFSGMQGCNSSCIEDSLSAAAARMNGSYQPSKGSEAAIGGVLVLTDPSSGEEVPLDLSNEAERVFAMEVVALHKRAADAVSKAESGASSAPAKLMDCTLAGPQMLRDAYGADSRQFRAALASVAALASGVLDDLCKCHAGKALGQVALLGDVKPDQPLLKWRSDVQPLRAARILQEAADGEQEQGEAPQASNQDTGAAGAQWSKTALTWTAFWVLLWFTWFALYSLCTMPFKQDSLLYSKNKSE